VRVRRRQQAAAALAEAGRHGHDDGDRRWNGRRHGWRRQEAQGEERGGDGRREGEG